MPLGFITAGIGLYDAFKGGGSHTGGAGANMYVPTGLPGADTGWQQNQATNQGQLGYGGGFAGQVDPNIYSAYQQLSGINYDPYLQASQQAGQQYGQLAGMAGMAGQQMGQQAMGNFAQQAQLGQAGQQVYNLGLDPQQALYNRTLGQVTDQTAASNSMYGLGSSGQGAALQDQALSNFNIDWQNQQLGRAATGLQAMAGANRIGGELGTLGGAQEQASMGYYGQQPGFTQQAAGVPMNAQQQVYGQPFADASQFSGALGSAMAPYQQQQNQAIPYMNYGSGAGANAYQNYLAGQQQQQNGLSQLGGALGNVDWNTIGTMFGSGGSSGSEGSLFGLFSGGGWGG